MNINGEVTSSPKCIAEKFNMYFVNVAPKLVSKQKPGKTKFHEYLTAQYTQTTLMSPVTIVEVNSLLANRDTSKGSDFYRFPVKIIKTISNIISNPLHIIFNHSLQSGTFPHKLRYDMVSPIHKGSPKDVLGNYREISVLPIFSKLLEEIMNKKLLGFLDKCEIIY